jgi:hypothetical protein
MKAQKFTNNHIILTDAETNTVYLQSYDTIVVKVSIGNRVTLDSKYNYSATTRKNVYKFLNTNKKDIETKLSNGIYSIENLNQ